MSRVADENDVRETRMSDRLELSVTNAVEFSVTKAVNTAAARLSKDLQGRMTAWEKQVQQQWVHFEKMWKDKFVQLEPGSKEGMVSMAEHRIWTSVQGDLEKMWSDRMGKEDKIMTNEYETLKTQQSERLTHEITNLKERKMGERGEHRGHHLRKRVRRGGTMGHGAPGAPGGFMPTRVELNGWGVWRNIRGSGITKDDAMASTAQTKTRLFPTLIRRSSTGT